MLRPVLSAFQPLLLSWTGNGEVKTLTRAEIMGIRPLGGTALMSAWYMNELLLRLLPREDAHPLLYDAYDMALQQLSGGTRAAGALRRFEWTLLRETGYGVDEAAPDFDDPAIEPGLRRDLRERLAEILAGGRCPRAACCSTCSASEAGGAMGFTLKQVETFRTVYETESVTAAARRLDLSPATVSATLAALEASIEMRLFERVRQRMHRTPEATLLYEEIRRLNVGLESLGRKIRAIRGSAQPRLRVGCIHAYSGAIVSDTIARFRVRYPDTPLYLQIRDSNTLRDMVVSGELDLAAVADESELEGAARPPPGQSPGGGGVSQGPYADPAGTGRIRAAGRCRCDRVERGGRVPQAAGCLVAAVRAGAAHQHRDAILQHGLPVGAGRPRRGHRQSGHGRGHGSGRAGFPAAGRAGAFRMPHDPARQPATVGSRQVLGDLPARRAGALTARYGV